MMLQIPFECQGHIYISFNGQLRDRICFSQTTTGVYICPLVVRVMNTWSLYMLHRDVYIRPWLLMPKQRGIQRVIEVGNKFLIIHIQY